MMLIGLELDWELGGEVVCLDGIHDRKDEECERAKEGNWRCQHGES
jgi:hypothetical protein